MMTSMATERDWKAEFESTYAGRPSAVAERVWRGVFGDEYPAGLDPFSGVSVSELERIAAEVRVGESETIADLGCGRGGPGLWVAMATGADLVGIDISSTALEAASERAARLGLDGRARVHEASFEDTGLIDRSADALMSIDALLFSTDKAAALAEVCEELAIEPRHVVAFGDHLNDVPMLAWAGHGVAVANAHPDVIDAADEVTASNEEDGVAIVLERLGA